MPEGPSIVILKELVQQFKGKKIIDASGNAPIDAAKLINKKVVDFKTWGKHFLICLPSNVIRVHLLMFGSYSINEQTKPARSLRLHLQFKNGSISFYTCSVKMLEEDIDTVYDWAADIMSDEWDTKAAIKKLQLKPAAFICDELLDQNIFSGVGNIIKNEILYRCKIHPESIVSKIPKATLSSLIKQARKYSFEFLKWKKAGELKKHWQAYSKKTCQRCDLPFKKSYTGKGKRRTFFCDNCQQLYK